MIGDRRFVVDLVKPSHYDDDGYVIEWWKSWMPPNSLACLYGLAADLVARHALGSDVAIEIRAHDECHTAREIVETHTKLAAFYLRLHRIPRRVERDQRPYSDPALLPIADPHPNRVAIPRP